MFYQNGYPVVPLKRTHTRPLPPLNFLEFKVNLQAPHHVLLTLSSAPLNSSVMEVCNAQHLEATHHVYFPESANSAGHFNCDCSAFRWMSLQD